MFSGLFNQAFFRLYSQPIDLGKALKLGAGNSTAVSDVYNNPADLVNVIVPTLFIIAGIIFFIMIVISAFKFFQDSSKGLDEARTIWKTALIGFILMFVAYWIVQIIQIVIGQKIL